MSNQPANRNHHTSFKPHPPAPPRTVERHGRRAIERPGWLERVLGGAGGWGLMRPVATTRDKSNTPSRIARNKQPARIESV